MLSKDALLTLTQNCKSSSFRFNSNFSSASCGVCPIQFKVTLISWKGANVTEHDNVWPNPLWHMTIRTKARVWLAETWSGNLCTLAEYIFVICCKFVALNRKYRGTFFYFLKAQNMFSSAEHALFEGMKDRWQTACTFTERKQASFWLWSHILLREKLSNVHRRLVLKTTHTKHTL